MVCRVPRDTGSFSGAFNGCPLAPSHSLPRHQISFISVLQGPIISFVVKGAHHLDVGTLLDLKGVAVRTGMRSCLGTGRG